MIPDRDNLKYLNAINIVVDGNVLALERINSAFDGDWEGAWSADLSSFIRDAVGREGSFTSCDRERRRNRQRRLNIESEWQYLERDGIDMITILDKDYPTSLRSIHNPPFLLYVRGSRKALQSESFAVVGTRLVSDYGKQATEHIVGPVSRAGLTIVSGLAYGIDAIAHKTALDEGGLTVAVLATYIADRSICPRVNFALAQRIIKQGGALISEFPRGYQTQRFSFPQRNRIVSGLSRGVLVVEGSFKSGTMLTAKHAIDQNRDVFAVPGSIFKKNSQGTNWLINRGAKLVTSSEDILEDYGLIQEQKQLEVEPEDENEKKILAVIKQNSLTADEIVRETGLSTSIVSATLMIMEMDKKVRNTNDGKYEMF
ncbi:MAG: DNA-processing protein DprA [Parcubacteria group bacterium]